VCLYSFDAQNVQELSFAKNERLDILDHPVDVSDLNLQKQKDLWT
jgi:hypothetical protein